MTYPDSSRWKSNVPPVRFALLLTLLCSELCSAQTTQGMISGRIRDQLTNAPLGGVTVQYEQLESNTHGDTVSSKDGSYYLPSLPPGEYHVRVAFGSKSYQAREIYGVQLLVAGYVLLNFDLRPMSDVWERGRYGSVVFRNNTVLPFFGPDVDPSYVGDFEPERRVPGQLEPSISAVVDPAAIAALPLFGRDVFTALVLQQGVTAESTTTRSLGLSANGQRPTSSNFLLDGAEANDSLLSGPALQLAPEMVQEYRVSTNNFSAEYGRTSGYIANAITRSGGAAWHGIGYGDLNNQVLNANTFEHNLNGLPRSTLHQIEAGFSVGGRVGHSRLFTWTALDHFGSRSFADPARYTLPTRAFYLKLKKGSVAEQVLREHPPVEWADSSFGDQGPVWLSVPITLRRTSALERVDYALSRKHQVSVRVAGEELRRPDFNWSPYGMAPLSQSSFSGVAAVNSAWTSRLTSEVRASFIESARDWDLALADLPQSNVVGGPQLPGSCCQLNQINYGWRDRTRTFELAGSFAISWGEHLVKVGAGVLDSRTRTSFKIPVANGFTFLTLQDFAADNPYQLDTTSSRLARASDVYRAPNPERAYEYDQPYAFVQEDWRVSNRLTLNAGFRYDRFPAPVNDGSTPDVVVKPGIGATFSEQIAGAFVASQNGSLFVSSPNNWSLRLAFSAALSKGRGTVLRGGFGTFHDRAPDNFFVSAEANDLLLAAFSNTSCPVASFYQRRQYGTLPAACPLLTGGSLFDLTMFQPGLSSPRVQSFFLSLQQPFGRDLSFELNGVGSRGRQLLTTDILNRQTGFFPPANGLPNLDYRTSQGFSDYAALSLAAHYRASRMTLNASYTWSHSIDNQSDPLLGGYFDLGFSNQTNRVNQQYFGAFSFVGDTRGDRGNSDFDQRHNLVGWASVAWPSSRYRKLQPLLKNWTSAAVFAARSGLPYSVYAGVTNCFPVCNTRANVINPTAVKMNVPVPGGVQLLNPAAFSVPPDGQQGSSGRNAFGGPGFASLDLSVARSFSLPWLRERGRLTLRADVFSLFNHPILQNPEGYFGYLDGDGNTVITPGFGSALYGAASAKTGFPSLTPLLETSRQIHLLVRLEF